MPLLPRVVRAVLVPVVVLTACVAGATGCASIDKALGQQQALVGFKDGTSIATRLQVRAACGKLPNVSPTPLPSGVPLRESLDQVVYQVNNASDADEARLQECVEKYPSVVGLTFSDSTDQGS
ncbi:MAG TPA: hypothetical protein VI365_10135 [Trebonia sp.]